MSRLEDIVIGAPMGVLAEVSQSLILDAVRYLGSFRAYLWTI